VENEANFENLIELYKNVFAGPPWFEYRKCDACGVNYGEKEVGEKMLSELSNCKNCNENLILRPFYKNNGVGKIISSAVSSNGFCGFAAKSLERLVAFSWGFNVPNVSTPTVQFEKVSEMLSTKGLDSNGLFYAAETGVLPEFQKLGLGTQVSKARLLAAKNSGSEGVVFRTINPKLVRVYEKLFGEVEFLFNDPQVGKEDRKWFFCEFEKMRL
jgi:GNAT superfamily N-acetyltransferase